MKTNLLKHFSIHLVTLLVLNFYGLSMALAQEILVDQNAKKKEAFVLLQSEMIDKEAFFIKYAIPAEMVVSAHSGQAIVATFDKKVVEGAWNNNWTIILKFPSLKAATDWYYSDKYQALIPYRHAATAFGNMVIFEGTPESVMYWSITQYNGISPTLHFPLTLDPTPEYVVTVSPSGNTTEDQFVVSASFDEISYKGANLSLEMKIPASSINDGNLDFQFSLKDTAGHHVKLGTVHATNFTADKWHNIQFGSNADADDRNRHVNDGEPIDLTKINALEIAFGADHKPIQVSGDIQIRNLKI